MSRSRRQPYPVLDAYNSFRLQVSDLHNLYVEESGNPKGKPVIVLHGGPGAGCNPGMRRFFDPRAYRVILFDQRGCGRSTPHACLEDNTTWDLVADIEAIREHLGIDRWQVFGGSWGSTLALAYAETHPERVTELVLRGIFLIRRQEIDWFYNGGAAVFWPELWEKFCEPIPLEERGDMVAAYHRRLIGEDHQEQVRCARAWAEWEGATVSLIPDPGRVTAFGADAFALAFARIEAHYFINGGFMPDGALLENIDRLRGIPAVIAQGRYDVVTPPGSAWDLHKAWPGSELRIAPDAGHAVSEPGISSLLIEATDRFADR